MALHLAKLRDDPLDALAAWMASLSRRWPVVLGLPLALALLFFRLLPRRAAAGGAPERARFWRTLAWQTLTGAGLDLGLMAGLPLLQLSYAPVGPAFFDLLCGRTAIVGGGVALALGGAGGGDLPPARRRALGRLLWALHAAMTFLVVYATYIDAQHLGTSRYALAFRGRRGPAARVRVAQVSDIHMERMTRRDRAVVARLRAAQPDLIVLTGDYINIDYYDVRAYEDLRALLAAIAALAPPLGAYACLGNVDPPLLMTTLFAGTGICLLQETAVTIPVGARRVQVVGARTTRGHRWQFDLQYLRAALAVAGTQAAPDLRILLYHTPDMVPQAAAAGVDLYLCGHTHGGQVRLPLIGALRTGSRFGRQFVMGLNRLPSGGYIYTNRGAGFEGMYLPRLRVLCPPEVAVFDLTVGEATPRAG